MKIAFIIFVFAYTLLSCEGYSEQISDGINSIENIEKEILNDSSIVSNEERIILLDEYYINAKGLKDDDELRSKLLLRIIKAYNEIGENETALKINKELYEYARASYDSLLIGDSLLNLGYHYIQQDQQDSAYYYYYRAERIFDQIDDRRKSGNATLNMAIIQKDYKDFVGAEANSIKTIRKFTPADSVNDLRYLASAYNNLGIVSRSLGNYENAISYYEKAIEYRIKQRKNIIINAGSYNNIGLVYTDKGEYDKAIDFYNKGLQYDSLFIKRPKTYARLLDNLTYARFLSGEEADYPNLFERSLHIRDSLKDKSGLATGNLHIADYYARSGYPDAANNYGRTALDISKSIPYNKGVLESLMLLAKVNPPTEALKYSNEYIGLSDSLQREQSRFRNQFARIRYETEELEQENTKVTRQRKWLINAILGIVSLTLLSYILIQRSIAKKELRFRESQQQANEEIYSLMLNQQGKLEEGKQLEKQRISEELHDSVLGRLFGIRLSLAGLNHKEGEKVIETRKKFIDELKGLGQEIRQISHDLNASTFALDKLYEEVVEELIQTQCERFELKYDFKSDPEIRWDTIPDNHKVHLYRIIQESLQNINKHAKANTVTVHFEREQENHVLLIKDDGVGIEKRKTKRGIGFKNMQSRVARINGKIHIDGRPGQGTELAIKFAFKEAI